LQPLRVGVVEDRIGKTVGRVTVQEGDGLDGANEAMLQAQHYICNSEGSRAAVVDAESGGVVPSERAEIQVRSDRGHTVELLALDGDEFADAVADVFAQALQCPLDLFAECFRIGCRQGQRLNGQPLPLPPQISKALYAPDPVLTGADRGLVTTDWRAEYAALCEKNSEDLPSSSGDVETG
jgi:hypothetical protein